MNTQQYHQHREKIKSAINDSNHLSEDEKSQSVKQIDEWILEDKAEGLFYAELVKIASGIKPILEELGLN